MFRLSQYMRWLARYADGDDDTANVGTSRPARRAPGPVVIWNLVRRCNLACRHCYSVSADIDFPGELDTAEITAVMEDLRAYGVPVLILSGGEPLLRPDIFEISRRARALGFYTGLSSNGTLIDETRIGRIAEIGYDYVGISLDGIGATHDRFRRRDGAFGAALRGLRLCRDAGIKVGMRVTPTPENAAELPELIALMRRERVDKLYVSHLNYGGRGARNRADRIAHACTREVMDLLFETAWEDARGDGALEIVTGNNDADGVYLLLWAERRLPALADALEEKLRAWGGNASGVGVANIDTLGNVHPDTFWWNYTLGNVRERSFSSIWEDRSDPLMDGLKREDRPLRGRCGVCPARSICRGNTRVRAFQSTGDPWWADPGCYLDDAELGIDPAAYAAERPRPVAWSTRVIRRAG